MRAVTIRLPDDTLKRLKDLSKLQDVSASQLIRELIMAHLVTADAEVRFAHRARRGQATAHRGQHLLGKARGLPGV
ncbi:MAG TPA: CopG family transcriptional regulator [Burkholderiaceae bacterium]